MTENVHFEWNTKLKNFTGSVATDIITSTEIRSLRMQFVISGRIWPMPGDMPINNEKEWKLTAACCFAGIS